MDVLWRDITLSVRMLRKNLRFSLMVVAIVAVGIGAGATILSVVEQALVRGWPNSDRIFVIRGFSPTKNASWYRFSVPEFNEAKQIPRVFQEVGAIGGGACTLLLGKLPEQRECTLITHNVMGMRVTAPLLGRGFSAEDDRPGAPPTTILSYGVWQQRFHGDRNVVGQAIRVTGGGLADTSYTVIGVMPQYYDLWGGELWMPFRFDPADNDRVNRRFWILTLLRPEVTIEQANRAVAQFARQLEQQHAGTNPEYTGVQMDLWNVKEAVVAAVKPSLLILLGAVALLLLIACGNVGSLLLVRAAGRQREMAIRSALGATRTRIVRQLLTESVILAATGGGLGVLLAVWGIPVVVALVPWFDLPGNGPVRLDAMPLLVTAGVSVLVGVFIGLAPALFAARRDLMMAVREGGAQGGRSRQARLTHASFVVAEIALAVVVLVGAGLMIRTYRELLRLDLGIKADHLLTTQIGLPATRYHGVAEMMAFYRELLPRISAQPGVQQVAAASGRPIIDRAVDLSTQDFQLEGRRGETATNNANFLVITPEYFRVVGEPLLRGRFFDEADDLDHPTVAIINQTMARLFWPNADPIGQRVLLGNHVSYVAYASPGRESPGTWATIVGVVADAKQIRVIDAPVRQEMFFPLKQRPEYGRGMALLVRTQLGEDAAVETVRRQVLALDPEMPLVSVHTMEQAVSDAFGSKRLTTTLLGFFAFVAVLLAAVGLYALIAYSVAQRTREFGIRTALGARRHHILRLVLRESTRLVVIGVVTGIAIALAATQMLRSMLFQVSPTDPATFAAVAILLAAIALLASYLPARRATRVNPLVALHHE